MANCRRREHNWDNRKQGKKIIRKQLFSNVCSLNVKLILLGICVYNNKNAIIIHVYGLQHIFEITITHFVYSKSLLILKYNVEHMWQWHF